MPSRNNKLRAIITLLLMMVVQMTYSQVITINNPFYTSHYDLQLQCPKQVSWLLRSSDIGNVKRSPSWKFMPDIPHPLAKATHDDYNHSGYHRGHLCPAKDRSFQICAMRSTFTTSNIAPQVPSVNTGSWLQTETWCRNAAILYDSVCVLAVPIFLDRDTVHISKNRLAVPHAFFKAVWLPKNDSVINAWFIFNH